MDTSEFYKMVVTLLQLFYRNQKLKIFQCRNHTNFENNQCLAKLKNKLLKIDLDNADLSEFTRNFISLLDKQAQKKFKYLRKNSNFWQ